MLRLDPGEGPHPHRAHSKSEGGGEYNTWRGLAHASATKRLSYAFVDNEIGHLVEDFIMQGAVDRTLSNGAKTTALVRTVRNGLNFTERGFDFAAGR